MKYTDKQPSRIQFAHYVECLDMIEKLMYNAIEGCMNLPICQDKDVLKFFVGNRKVCQVYFRRDLRNPLVKALYKFGVSSTSLIHQSSQSATYSWSRFIRYLISSKYHILKMDRSLVHAVHQHLYILAYGLMNIGDVPGLLGIKQYFQHQVMETENTRIRKWKDSKQKSAPKSSMKQLSIDDIGSTSNVSVLSDTNVEKANIENIDEKSDDEKDEHKDNAEDEENPLELIPTWFDLTWLDAMIENAKGCCENAVKLYFKFIQQHISDIEEVQEDQNDNHTVESTPGSTSIITKDTDKDKDKENNKDKDKEDSVETTLDNKDKDKDKEKEKEKSKSVDIVFFTKEFLNRVAHLGLKCCIDAADWTSYNTLYDHLAKVFENNLGRLAEIRGYEYDYMQSLEMFDQGRIRTACQTLENWELNLGVNPLKSATIPTNTRKDLFKTADMYHLQALLLSLTSKEESNNSTQNNKNASNAKLATRFCAEIFRDPLRVVSHSNYNDQYSMLLRISCSRAVELSDLNVLNSFVHSIRFDENDILNHTPSKGNNQYLLISHLKMSDLTLAKRTISAVYKYQKDKYEKAKQMNGGKHLEKIYNDTFATYADFMYTYARWNLIVNNNNLAMDVLDKLQNAASPAHLFLSTLAHNNNNDKMTVMDELGNWLTSINVTEQKWPSVQFSATKQYQSYCYLQMAHILNNKMDHASIQSKDDEEKEKEDQVSETITFINKLLPNIDTMLTKYKLDNYFQLENENTSESSLDATATINKALLWCHLQSTETWPAGKSNWLSLAKFTTKMTQQISVPLSTDSDKKVIEAMLNDKNKARKVFNTMISVMHETTLKLNQQSLNQDFSSATFGMLSFSVFSVFFSVSISVFSG